MKKNRKNEREPVKKGTMLRLIRTLFRFFPVIMPLVTVCTVFSAIITSLPSVFMQKVLAVIEQYFADGNWSAAKPEIIEKVGLLALFYVISILSLILETQILAYVTQGFLYKLRKKMFDGMQSLPIRYFDTHKNGDIMSYYTNDIDTIREMVSSSLPNLLKSGVIVLTVFGIMLYYSVWLTLLVLAGVAAMILFTKKIGGKSAGFFVKQQKALGKV